MSLSKFSNLFYDLDSNNGLNKKIEILILFFKNNSDLDNAWTIYLLSGKANKRFISGKLMRTYYSEIYKLPIWLIETCYSKVGDSAEVISLLLKENIKTNNNIQFLETSINKLMKFTLPKLRLLDHEDQKLFLKNIWESTPRENFLVLNKILTGTFRIGVSKGLVTKSIAKMIGVEESIISHRLMGEFKPSTETFKFLTNKKLDLKELNYKPYPFQLANTLEEKIKKFDVNEYNFEWKWDGIRSQLIKRSNNISIWTRGEELVNNSFPELIPIIKSIPDDFVLDGEILVWNLNKNIPNDFSFLQKRLGRKSPSSKIQKDFPVSFIIYDLLEKNGIDLRNIYLIKRREILEKSFNKWGIKENTLFNKKLKITQLLNVTNWEEVEKKKNKSRETNTEGLMIKKKNSKYLSGRKKGIWWKYKVDPVQLDGILIYAKTGSGKRADLYTDYSFALWDNNKLVKFANAYSGLTNQEIKELDKWIRKNTLERFGPVRSVKPEMVFEISFDKIQISKRHKSGLAVRFPRITKWRRDKNIKDADNLNNAFQLMRIEK